MTQSNMYFKFVLEIMLDIGPVLQSVESIDLVS
jgi:hypothetical protein